MLVVPLLLLLLPALSLAQDGSISGPTSSSDAAGYSCDTSACKLPKCNCASASPPGGLSPVRAFLKSLALSCCPASSFLLKEASSGLNHYRLLTSCCQSDVPQFIVYTADDAIQSYTLDSVNQFLAQRKNPNGCPPRITYYVSLNYTNYTLVTDWFVAGNEIADHTWVTPILFRSVFHSACSNRSHS